MKIFFKTEALNSNPEICKWKLTRMKDLKIIIPFIEGSFIGIQEEKIVIWKGGSETSIMNWSESFICCFLEIFKNR